MLSMMPEHAAELFASMMRVAVMMTGLVMPSPSVHVASGHRHRAAIVHNLAARVLR
jgi:hypothetical protein